MIVGQCHIHHRADDHLAGDCDGPLLDGVQAEDAALGWIDQRRGQQRSINAAVGEGERAAPQFVRFDFIFLHPLRKVSDALLDLSKTHPPGVAEHGNDQPTTAADGNRDVMIVAIDDIAAANFGVELRNLPESFHGRFDEERHEAQLDLVAFEESLLIFFAQRHDGGHVDLVESGKQGGSVLGGDETLSDLPAQEAHRHHFLGPLRMSGRIRWS